MKKETKMKKIEIPSITAVLNSIRRMPADELLLVIEAANFELAQAIEVASEGRYMSVLEEELIVDDVDSDDIDYSRRELRNRRED